MPHKFQESAQKFEMGPVSERNHQLIDFVQPDGSDYSSQNYKDYYRTYRLHQGGFEPHSRKEGEDA